MNMSNKFTNFDITMAFEPMSENLITVTLLWPVDVIYWELLTEKKLMLGGIVV